MAQTTVPNLILKNLTEVVFTASNSSYRIPSTVTGIWALCIGAGGGGGAATTATATNGGGGGGAGQALEKFFAIAGGDTLLNITVPSGGAGGTAGSTGSNGSAATIVGNVSGTTYLSAAGGGGGGGGAAANANSLSGASSGGGGIASAILGGGGGGMGSSASDGPNSVLGSLLTQVGAAPANPTTFGVTGYSGGGANSSAHGGIGITIWGRSVCGGGIGGVATTSICSNFGAGVFTANNTVGSSATANTGAGGNSGRTTTSTAFAGGAGGSGLVVLRFVI